MSDLDIYSPGHHTILIADDDGYTRETLARLLSEENTVVVEASSGSEAVQICCDTAWPDLILLDSVMPGLDGFETCRQIRQLPGGTDLPIIMLAASDSEDAIDRAFEAGATDYVLKPVRQKVLRQRVRYLLQMRQMQYVVRASEERYRIISNMISDYAYAYDVAADGTFIKNWNTQAFHDITGYSREELMNGDWGMLIHPDDMSIALARYQRLMGGETDISEFRIISKSGAVRWLRDHGFPVVDETTGRVTKIYGAAQEITHRKDYEEKLQHQAEELRQRNEELDAFAYTVAHDLKNPIASMMGFASLIQNYYDRMSDDTIKEYLDLIMEGGYKLKEIINALLILAGVSKMEKAEMSPLDMSAIVEQTKRRLTAMIAESSAVILVPVEWPIAAGYAPWVEEIWANYISNALKYGGRPPQIELGADTLEDGMVRFWVRDNGRGLTLDEQQRVFTPFTRLNQVKVEGHGLGLSVVQRIVAKLGGSVGVESTVGQGSKFTFTLPTT